jgi:phosphoribosylformylglycinamidine (FGAM) synthase PurS component
MNLPLVLDIALGVIFIYLILSLLASEIQELLATILQWRAVHLRKSIEILLTGGEDTAEAERVKGIVDQLYSNPLIKSLNQESKEGIAVWFRQLLWSVGRVYRKLRNKQTTTFGEEIEQNGETKARHSAPSYIPSETFATTLLTRLNLTTLIKKLSLVNLISFKEQEIILKINEIIDSLTVNEVAKSGLRAELSKLEKNLDKIFIYFKNDKLTLFNSLKRVTEELDKYIENSPSYFSEADINTKKEFVENLTYLKQDIFVDQDNLEALMQRLRPSLTEIINIFENGHTAFQGFQNSVQDPNSESYKAYQEIKVEIEQVINELPQSLRASLAALAQRTQIKASTTEEELNQFKKEIGVWFDRSMDRASGVYKRNAKGIAFLIGLFLAFVTNTDTLYIISRLSKDTPLRNTITQNAGQLASDSTCTNSDSQEQSKLDCIRDQVDKTLDPLTLPIGWDFDSFSTQPQKVGEAKKAFSPLRSCIGWLISGLAISMGAPFWFEVLGKIMNVRNTGRKPTSNDQE